MKQCPACKRTYTDERLSYCLDDGTALINLSAANPAQSSPVITQPSPRVKYNPTPTQPTATFQFAASPQMPETPSKSKGKGLLIFALLGLFLLVVIGGLLAFIILRKSNGSVISDNTSSNLTGNSNASANKGMVSVSPLPPSSSSPGSSPTAAQLVGTWKTSVVENKVPMDITVTFKADGTSKFLFRNKQGQTGTDTGTWQYSEGILYERYSNGSSGKGSVKWIDNDNADITIIDNGVPAYNGVVRHYHRVN